MLTSLPPLEFLTKNHEILGFETYIHYYPYYFLRIRDTDRKAENPLVGPDWVRNHTKHTK